MIAAERQPRFAMFVSGFVPRDTAAAAALLRGVPSSVRSLHAYGASDALVVPERSRALAELFEGAVQLEHPGGHMTPSSAAVRTQVTGFVDAVLADVELEASPVSS